MKLSAFLLIGFLTATFAGAVDSKNQQPALAKAEALWAQRGQPAQARQCLAAYMEAAVALPAKSEVWYRLARIRNLVATYIEKDPAIREQLLLQGMDAAWRGLDLNPAFHAEFARTHSEKKAVEKVGREDLDGLYWYSVNLGRWAADQNILTRLRKKSLLEALNHRILDLDETYFYGAAHRFFGALPTKIPGGNLQDSRAHFETAIRIAPNYFPTRTLFAELYAVKAKDQALFITQLRYVLDHPADSLIDVTPENRYEQENAHNLMTKVGTLFP